MNMERTRFGETQDGEEIHLYHLTNSDGLRVGIITYGAIIVSMEVPDRDGKLADVVLGFDTLSGYLETHPYFGAVVGRYANRIAKGQFTLNDVEYTLATNNGENHLHGGLQGFDKAVWQARELQNDAGLGVEFSYLSADGEEGYPGDLSTRVIYTLTNKNELKVDYYATTDKPTILNLTQHTYFNLSGQGTGTVLDHHIMINADHFTPVDEGLIPTGEVRPVAGTPFDFRQATAIGSRIGQDNEQLRFGGGYDHNFVLNKSADSLELAARVTESGSGRVMEVHTSEPGVQFYTGNFLDGSMLGKSGRAYQHRHGFCLETQHFPNSPNEPSFPSVVLSPEETYRHTTIFKFSTQ